MTQPENVLVQNIRDALADLGCMTIKVHGSAYSVAGTPDIIGCYKGHAFVIEVKVPGKDATEIQQYQLGLWGKAGARAGVAHSVIEAINIVQWGTPTVISQEERDPQC